MPPRAGTIDDESLVPDYTLPELLEGTTTAADWWELDLATHHGARVPCIYGLCPAARTASRCVTLT
jgi:hypothetical protein